MKKAEKVEQFPSTKIIWENIMGNIKYILIELFLNLNQSIVRDKCF